VGRVGKARSGIVFRPLDGVLLLDKPLGVSSNQALQHARKLFRAAKGGHTGSLDPLATGLLPLCFGEATKLAGGLLGARKAYTATARLGQVTDTDDTEGVVLRERPVPPLDRATVEAALARLEGRIHQRPPVYSALKRGGEPLYVLARRGEVVEVESREVDVHAFALAGDGIATMPDGTTTLSLDIECGSGTYIRSLVRDLGELLGCGAHVATLRRAWVDPFRGLPAWTPEAIEARALMGDAALDACLLPIEAALAAWPCVRVDARQALCLAHGQPVDLDGSDAAPGEVGVLGPDGRGLGLAGLDPTGRLRPKRLFAWASAAHPGRHAR
jgi:tRNA pseudouridine55 synthase